MAPGALRHLSTALNRFAAVGLVFLMISAALFRYLLNSSRGLFSASMAACAIAKPAALPIDPAPRVTIVLMAFAVYWLIKNGWNEESITLSIEVNLGEIIGGSLAGLGIASAGLTYSVKSFSKQ